MSPHGVFLSNKLIETPHALFSPVFPRGSPFFSFGIPQLVSEVPAHSLLPSQLTNQFFIKPMRRMWRIFTIHWNYCCFTKIIIPESGLYSTLCQKSVFEYYKDNLYTVNKTILQQLILLTGLSLTDFLFTSLQNAFLNSMVDFFLMQFHNRNVSP